MSMHLLYKFKRVLFIYFDFSFIVLPGTHSKLVTLSFFDFLNHFGFKRFGLILI